jgi:hypothetical protein
MLEIVTKLSNNWRPLDKKKKGYELLKTGRAYSHIKFCLKYIPNKKDNPISSLEDINTSEIEYMESMIINNVNPIIIESLVTAYNSLLDIVGQTPSKNVVAHLDKLGV